MSLAGESISANRIQGASRKFTTATIVYYTKMKKKSFLFIPPPTVSN